MEGTLKVLIPIMATVWVLVESLGHLSWVQKIGKPIVALFIGLLISGGLFAAGYIITPHGGWRGLAAALVGGFLAVIGTKGAHDTIKSFVKKSPNG